MSCAMQVMVLALCRVFVSAGHLRTLPVDEGVVHKENKAVATQPAAQEVTPLVHKNPTEPEAKEITKTLVTTHAAKDVAHNNVTKPVLKDVALLAHKNPINPAAHMIE